MKVGIVGAGSIVPGFLAAQEKVNQLEVTAICGLVTDQTVMEDLAKRFCIETIYYDFDMMVSRTDIDVIYVALPNSLHYRFGMIALEHGKHVIMEKPFASTVEQAQEMIHLAQEKELVIFDAVSNQYTPAYRKIKEKLQNLGELKIVDINYSVYSKRYAALESGEKVYPVFDRKQGGGVLRDMGVYALYFVVGLFGAPIKIHYYANMMAGVDTSGVILLQYPTFLCTMTASKDSYGDAVISIQGDHGYIHSTSTVNDVNSFRVREYTIYQMDEEKSYRLNNEKEHLYYELVEFVKMVETNDMTYRDERLIVTLQVLKLMDQALSQIGMTE